MLGFLAGFVERAWTDQGPSVQGGVKESISDAVLSLLEAVARTRPSVFCMEDIHWADQSTLDLLGYLAHAWEARCPCLLLVTHRQDMDRALPGTCMRIRELGDDDIGRMIKLMLKADTLPDALLGFLARATGGNPFYLEEVVNFLLEQGVDPCSYGRDSVLKDVPVTLYGLVSSRLDHLGPDARGMLQVASLMGRTFSVDLLSHFCGGPGVLDAAVQSALRHGFIQPAGGAQFAFRHEITRDVAARTLLKGERSMLHRKIAFTMEETLGPRAPEHAEELARHFRQAGEDERAIHYCMEAARRALASGAWVEAAGHYGRPSSSCFLQRMSPGRMNGSWRPGKASGCAPGYSIPPWPPVPWRPWPCSTGPRAGIGRCLLLRQADQPLFPAGPLRQGGPCIQGGALPVPGRCRARGCSPYGAGIHAHLPRQAPGGPGAPG
jgi:hypothetical protein